MPEKLGELFKDILKRDTANVTDLPPCLQLNLFAKKVLTRKGLSFVTVTGLDPERENLAEQGDQVITLDDMSRFVLN